MIENLPLAPSSVGRICVDFDGVLAESEWPSPEIGPCIQQGVHILLMAEELGYEVIIYTARPASHEARIWEWLKDEGLYGLVYDVVTGKPVADLYVDDKAYNPFLPMAVGEELREDGAANSLATSSDDGRSKAPVLSFSDDDHDFYTALGENFL